MQEECTCDLLKDRRDTGMESKWKRGVVTVIGSGNTDCECKFASVVVKEYHTKALDMVTVACGRITWMGRDLSIPRK